MYLIYACEGTYEGLYGVYDVDLIEGITYDQAIEIGTTMSYEVMERYDLPEIDEEDEDTTTYEQYESFMRDNVNFSIWKVDSSKTGNKTFKELREEVQYNWEEFVEKYCVEVED